MKTPETLHKNQFDCDVIVIGGGMGGLSTAALLAQEGYIGYSSRRCMAGRFSITYSATSR